MNAQECRTLTATCMHIAWLTEYIILSEPCYNMHATCITTVHVQYQEYWTTYPTPEQSTGILLTTYPAPKQGSGTRVKSWGKAPGYATMYTVTTLTELCTWEPLPVYTVTVLTTDQQSTECSWGRCHVNTDWQQLHTLLHWAGLNMTTLPLCHVSRNWMCTFSMTTLTI